MAPVSYPEVLVYSAPEWRAWLQKHETTAPGAWLVLFHKDAGLSSLTYDQAVEEALCFGWVDSKPRKRDSQSSFLFFAPRNPKSNWSRANRERAERLLANGKMTPTGERLISLAKQSGTWKAIEGAELNIVPPDLARALYLNEKAQGYFEAFPPSSKRIILEWIGAAKLPKTREARIAQTVRLAEENIRANHYRQPKRTNV